MYDVKNPMSAMSYTNKDFQSIYVELLDAAKALAANWDPTISNESDPGVVLIKLNAIIGDKNNYNIDKNILENYPETYTQEISARSQYRQLGYKMPWYKAASTDITFTWVGKKLEQGQFLTIPKYTMVVDSEDSIVYTITEEASLGNTSEYWQSAKVQALQGVITTLSLSGNTVITLSNLDYNNRLYVNDHNIAQNAIFVSNSDDIKETLWEQVPNVETTPSLHKCFEFDIDARTGVPYLQFPDDIKDIIGNGLTVRYIVTSGADGNIAANTLTSFYNDNSVTLQSINGYIKEETVALNKDNINLTNIKGTVDGKDPETIEEAYKSFKKLVATFDTLVTLRDYNNAIYGLDNVISNCIVTDRTNDIQNSYRIIDKKHNSILDNINYQTKKASKSFEKMTKVENDVILYKYDEDGSLVYVGFETLSENPEDEKYYANYYKLVSSEIPDMSAFDLKLYLLKSGGNLRTLNDYENTFSIDIDSTTKNTIATSLENQKSIQHDFCNIQENIPFMLQNIYPIKVKIVPTYKLTASQIDQVTSNIRQALINLLNSRAIEFGVEPSYDNIYNTILAADERIKVLIMDDFNFTTYAVYMEKDKTNKYVFKYVPISDYSNNKNIIVRNTNNELINALQDLKHTTNSDIIASQYMFVNSTEGKLYKFDVDLDKHYQSEHNPETCGCDLEEIIAEGCPLRLYSDRLLDIRLEVIAKNILAGVTPLFDVNDTFNLSLGMDEVPAMSGSVDNIDTALTIKPFGNATFDDSLNVANYTLKENENLRFFAPSFTTDATYSNYVKFELVLGSPIENTEKYVYADPDDATDLFAKYGPESFHVAINGGERYERVHSTCYQKNAKISPFIKLDSYFSDISTTTSSYIPYSKYLKNQNKLDKYKVSGNFPVNAGDFYKPLFEKNLYFERSVGSEGYQYHVVNNVGVDWDENVNHYFIRKAYVPGELFADDIKTSFGASYLDALKRDPNAEPLKVSYSQWTSWNDVLNHEKVLAGNVGITNIPSGTSKNAWKNWILLDKYYKLGKEPEYGDPLTAAPSNWNTSWNAGEINKSVNEYYAITSNDGEADTYKPLFGTAIKDLYDAFKTLYNGSEIVDEETFTTYDADDFKKLKVGDKEDSPALSSDGIIPNFDAFKGIVVVTFKNVYTEHADMSSIHTCFNSTDIDQDSGAQLEKNVYRPSFTPKSAEEDIPDSGLAFRVNLSEYLGHDPKCYMQVPNKYSKFYYQEVNGDGYLTMITDEETLAEYRQDSSYEIYKMDAVVGDYDEWFLPVPNNSLSSAAVEFKSIGDTYVYPFKSEVYYVKEYNTEQGKNIYKLLNTMPENWTSDYLNYYSLNDGNFSGLAKESPEYEDWLKKELALYVPELTYTIPAETEYQLRKGDYLTFFWRETDEDDAPYSYIRYNYILDKDLDLPTIIKASFTLKGHTMSDCLINPANLGDSGKIKHNSDPDSNFSKVYSMYGDYDLSGTKSIEIRKINHVKLDSGNNRYYYAINNNKVKKDGIEYFKMTLNKVKEVQPEGSTKYHVTYRYTLGNEEFFIYMNKDKSGFEMLSVGTMIELRKIFDNKNQISDTFVIESQVVDVNLIAYNGSSVFEDYCSKVLNTETFLLIEQQIYSLTANDRIQIVMHDSFKVNYEKVEDVTNLDPNITYYTRNETYSLAPKIQLDNGSWHTPDFISNTYYEKIGENKYKLIEKETFIAPEFIPNKYWELKDQTYERVPTCPTSWNTQYGNYYELRNGSYYKVAGISDWKNTFWEEFGNTVAVYVMEPDKWNTVEKDENGEIPTNIPLYVQTVPSYPTFSSNQDTFVKDFSVSYATGDGSFTSLPDIHLTDSTYGWNGSAYLNLSMSNEQYQEVSPPDEYSIQEITINGETYPPVNENGKYDYDITPLYLLSNVLIDKVGGGSTDVSYVDLTGERHPIDVLAYQINKAFQSSDWEYTTEGKLLLKVDLAAGAEYVKEITNMQLSSGFDYILPINCSTEHLQIRIEGNDGTSSYPLNCLCHNTLIEEGIHFIKIPNSVKSLKFILKNTGSGDINTSVLFDYMFKYKERDIFDRARPKYIGVNTQSILGRIRELDKDGVFDYTHIPAEEIEILDPLVPVSTFDINHVYNKFTLPKANLVTDEGVGLMVTVVNNR